MAKVVTSVKPKMGHKTTAVTVKRVRDTAGGIRTIHTLDTGSKTFGSDLEYVFRKNVAKARRDNKQIVGSSDLVVPKH